jgi:hypothetical protein
MTGASPALAREDAAWIARVWREFHAHNLTPTWRDVLLSLRSFRGRDGTICPAHATLGQAVRCHENTVQRALQAARDLRLVDWAGRRVRLGWRALRTSNSYVLLVPKAPVIEAEAAPYPRLLRAGSVRALLAGFCTNHQNGGGGETNKQTGPRNERAGGRLGLELRRLVPHAPVRTVAQQLALLAGATAV